MGIRAEELGDRPRRAEPGVGEAASEAARERCGHEDRHVEVLERGDRELGEWPLAVRRDNDRELLGCDRGFERRRQRRGDREDRERARDWEAVGRDRGRPCPERGNVRSDCGFERRGDRGSAGDRRGVGDVQRSVRPGKPAAGGRIQALGGEPRRQPPCGRSASFTTAS